MIRDTPQFDTARKNLAALMWSGLGRYGFTLDSLWESLPQSTKDQIEAFILEPREPPDRSSKELDSFDFGYSRGFEVFIKDK